MGAEEFAPKSRLEITEVAVYEVNADRSKVTCEVQPESIIQCPDEDAECINDCKATF